MKIAYNISRLEYLLSLYRMTVDGLLEFLNRDRKRKVTREEIFLGNMDISYLKKIDRLFNKGLHFYLDTNEIQVSKEASIFFRKSSFNVDLSIGARVVVNRFEDLKISLTALAKLADINLNRILPVYTVCDNPKEVASDMNKIFYPRGKQHKKDFLTALITKFAERNILVFEFIEAWNKRERANIDGFFLGPNVIVLKRNQSAFSREIFTLLHELGHYLLNEEEIEEVDVLRFTDSKLNAIERWCNDFAYYFLAGNFSEKIDDLEIAGAANDYHHLLIESIAKQTHLSRIALYTRLLLQHKIEPYHYNLVKADLEEQYRHLLLEKEREQEPVEGCSIRGSV